MTITNIENSKYGRSLKLASSSIEASTQFNPVLAGIALVDGLNYLKTRLSWSGTKVAAILHLPANTVNTWLKNGAVPIRSSKLQPDTQAIVHLLAIHRSLEAMFEDPAHQKAWLSTLHPDLKIIPQELMSQSMEGLIHVRQYLDYIRGRGA